MAVQSFTYPSPANIKVIAQDFQAHLTLDDDIFDAFPTYESQEMTVLWEQLDNFFGLQQLRGLDGGENRVANTGGSTFSYVPPVFGEQMDVKESEVLRQRQQGMLGAGIDISELVMRKTQHLVTRRVQRIRHMLWTLLVTGSFTLKLPTGGTGFADSYTPQTFAASVWGTASTATPLGDFRSVGLLSLGHSVSFGSKAKAYMNPVTLRKLLQNANAADLGGKRVEGGNTVNSINGMNEILLAQDLPSIVKYERQYFDDTNTANWFIPTDYVVIIGNREDASPVGHFVMTPNVNNPDMAPGFYHKFTMDMNTVPPKMIVHDGMNGGPAIEFPSSVVIMHTA